jgi:hypothetical protein
MTAPSAIDLADGSAEGRLHTLLEGDGHKDALAVATALSALLPVVGTPSPRLISSVRAAVLVLTEQRLDFNGDDYELVVEQRRAATALLRAAEWSVPVGDGVFSEVGSRLGLPVLSWARPWWPVLEEFAAKATRKPTLERYLAYVRDEDGAAPHLTYPIGSLPEDLTEALEEFTAALVSSEMPTEGAAFFSGMTSLLGSTVRSFLAVVAETVRNQFADPTTALTCPLVRPGLSDGTFPLHADVFHQRLLLNIFERPSSTEGGSLFARSSDWMDAAGHLLTHDERDFLAGIWSFQTWSPNAYTRQEAIVGDPSRRGAFDAALAPVTLRVHLGPGEGYLLTDGIWLHGREWISLIHASDVRLHRLVFDNRTTYADRSCNAVGAALRTDPAAER